MMPSQATQTHLSAFAICFIAVSALAVAMGIGRFAFTPMLPLMLRDGAIAQSAGAALAAANYLGYLSGAMMAGRIRLSPTGLMQISLIGTAAVTAAVGVLDGLAIWLLLRFVAGLLSAWTFVATSIWALHELARIGRQRLAGFVYGGVGLGIAVAGVFCIVAARPGTSAQALWVELGGLAAVLITGPILRLGWHESAERAVASEQLAACVDHSAKPTGSAAIIICYGLFGFGYILPATFLPALAREVVDDPRLFGLAWPLFGLAAAVSTVAAALLLSRVNRLRVWACCHLIMAAGVVLPVMRLSLVTIAIAALLVGGTFMVITMLGMQEARARSPDNPTPILGHMTAAFATGQLVGPLASGAIDLLPIGHVAALNWALQLAAVGLAASSVVLWRLSRV